MGNGHSISLAANKPRNLTNTWYWFSFAVSDSKQASGRRFGYAACWSE